MNCEKCPYCRSEYFGESYDEDIWCDKGFGDGYKGCNHILPYLQKFLDILTSPYYMIKLYISEGNI